MNMDELLKPAYDNLKKLEECISALSQPRDVAFHMDNVEKIRSILDDIAGWAWNARSGIFNRAKRLKD